MLAFFFKIIIAVLVVILITDIRYLHHLHSIIQNQSPWGVRDSNVSVKCCSVTNDVDNDNTLGENTSFVFDVHHNHTLRKITGVVLDAHHGHSLGKNTGVALDVQHDHTLSKNTSSTNIFRHRVSLNKTSHSTCDTKSNHFYEDQNDEYVENAKSKGCFLIPVSDEGRAVIVRASGPSIEIAQIFRYNKPLKMPQDIKLVHSSLSYDKGSCLIAKLCLHIPAQYFIEGISLPTKNEKAAFSNREAWGVCESRKETSFRHNLRNILMARAVGSAMMSEISPRWINFNLKLTEAEEQSVLRGSGKKHTKTYLGVAPCTADCKHDNDCPKFYRCWRHQSGELLVPGCYGTPAKETNYCSPHLESSNSFPIMWTRYQECFLANGSPVGLPKANYPNKYWMQTRLEKIVSDNSAFSQYKWAGIQLKDGNWKIIDEVFDSGKLPDLQKTCFLGDSHARFLVGALKNARHVQVTYAMTIPKFVPTQCPAVVIHIGVWDLVFQTRRRKNWFEIESDFRANIAILKRDCEKKNIPMFVQSMNFIPARMDSHCCELGSFTMPPYVNHFNSIIQKIAEDYNIEFIDTRHITFPMWDTAPDWGHPSPQLLNALAAFVSKQVLQSL